MDTSDVMTGLAVAFIGLVLLASGPVAGGLIQPSGLPTTVDDGNATVTSVDVPDRNVHVSPGRFGTDVSYLRVPDARVDLATVSDHPRLVYRIKVPELGADVTTHRIVSKRGTHTLQPGDLGLNPDRVTEPSYEGTVMVRIQSFAADRTVYERNVTVEVRE